MKEWSEWQGSKIHPMIFSETALSKMDDYGAHVICNYEGKGDFFACIPFFPARLCIVIDPCTENFKLEIKSKVERKQVRFTTSIKNMESLANQILEGVKIAKIEREKYKNQQPSE